ncbi:putative signal peptide protein [Puccinia sorghi]|uniref:Putative signal peptide protein n=1 Tax=Puccinia sorghi TaxID=27349 RepID=A0A0L6V3U4_9BASI|nr:putative signal peptide protein [Puccinia sorghi]
MDFTIVSTLLTIVVSLTFHPKKNYSQQFFLCGSSPKTPAGKSLFAAKIQSGFGGFPVHQNQQTTTITSCLTTLSPPKVCKYTELIFFMFFSILLIVLFSEVFNLPLPKFLPILSYSSYFNFNFFLLVVKFLLETVQGEKSRFHVGFFPLRQKRSGYPYMGGAFLKRWGNLNREFSVEMMMERDSSFKKINQSCGYNWWIILGTCMAVDQSQNKEGIIYNQGYLRIALRRYEMMRLINKIKGIQGHRQQQVPSEAQDVCKINFVFLKNSFLYFFLQKTKWTNSNFYMREAAGKQLIRLTQPELLKWGSLRYLNNIPGGVK